MKCMLELEYFVHSITNSYMYICFVISKLTIAIISLKIAIFTKFYEIAANS